MVSLSIQELVKLCEQYVSQQNFAGLNKILTPIRNKTKNNNAIEFFHAFALYKQNKSDDALLVLNNFLENRQDAEFIRLKGEILWAQKKYNEAVELILNAAENNVLSTRLIVMAASFYIELFDLNKASDLIEKALQKNLDNDSQNLILSMKALLCFLKSDLNLTKDIISKINLNEKYDHLESGSVQKIMLIYAKFINNIISWAENNPNLYLPETTEKAYAIGDSHCLSSAYMNFEYKGKLLQIIPKLSYGTKAWHIHSNELKHKIDGIKNIISSLPNNSLVFIYTGEIDCRIDQGIFKNYLKDASFSIENNISQIIDSHINFFKELAKDKNLNLKFVGIPAPHASFVAASSGHLTKDQLVTYLSIPKIFNDKLRQKLNTDEFVDIYSYTAENTGLAKPNMHIDFVHLKPNILLEVLQEKFYEN